MSSDVAAAPEPERTASLAVPVIKPVGGKLDCAAMRDQMIAVIARLSDPAETAQTGAFIAANRASLETMRRLDREAWQTVQYELSRRDRVLRGGEP